MLSKSWADIIGGLGPGGGGEKHIRSEQAESAEVQDLVVEGGNKKVKLNSASSLGASLMGLPSFVTKTHTQTQTQDADTRTHTHTHTHVQVYKRSSKCVCLCLCVCVRQSLSSSAYVHFCMCVCI